MTHRMLPICLLLLASCAPAQDNARAPGRYVEKLKEGTIEREYILRVPKGYESSKPVPVVVALHGLGGNMNMFAAKTRIEEVADQEGFICVVPNGVPDSLRGWNTGFLSVSGTKDDVKLIADILDRVEKEFTTDKKRVFIFGHSNGAMMSYYLGGLMSDRIAAVAGIAGTIGIPGAASEVKAVPVPKFPISVLMIHGMKDQMVAFKPGDRALLQCTGAEEGAAWWAKQNGCEATGVKTDLVKDQSTITSYSKGKNGTEVRLICSINGSHDIPGPSVGVDSITEIWNFFKAHPKQ